MEIGQREAGATMRCCGDKKFVKCNFLLPFLRPFGWGRQKFAGERVT